MEAALRSPFACPSIRPSVRPSVQYEHVTAGSTQANANETPLHVIVAIATRYLWRIRASVEED